MRDIKVGQRVHVFSGDGETDLGKGRYEGDGIVRGLFVRTTEGLVLYSNSEDPTVEVPIPPGLPEGSYKRHETETPRIRLDNGDVIYGCQCWWEPIEEEP